MLKLHKRDAKHNLLYAECWVDDKKGITNLGKVGKTGAVKEFNLGETFTTAADFLTHFEEVFRTSGYSEFNEEHLVWLVVQYEMKSLSGNKRDHWLKEKTMEYLDEELGWRGIGKVDGFDMGAQINDEHKYALNIFCLVYDEEKGIAAIKRCLKAYRLDYTRIKIASRFYQSDNAYELKYTAKKKDQTFNL